MTDESCELTQSDVTICSYDGLFRKLDSAYWFLKNASIASTAPRGISKTELRNRAQEALNIVLSDIEREDVPEVVPIRNNIIEGIDKVMEFKGPVKERNFPSEFLFAARAIEELRLDSLTSCLNDRLKVKEERARYRREKFGDDP